MRPSFRKRGCLTAFAPAPSTRGPRRRITLLAESEVLKGHVAGRRWDGTPGKSARGACSVPQARYVSVEPGPCVAFNEYGSGSLRPRPVRCSARKLAAHSPGRPRVRAAAAAGVTRTAMVRDAKPWKTNALDRQRSQGS
jgi:hypothetical protein